MTKYTIYIYYFVLINDDHNCNFHPLVFHDLNLLNGHAFLCFALKEYYILRYCIFATLHLTVNKISLLFLGWSFALQASVKPYFSKQTETL